ncbi:hypothetical protein ACOX9X_11370 [Photobacterium leiognathi subsp. mandapamensis]|uniref:hypothetical protein n=1 Tax=Photobacterium leiognathi TaxID=553611 RepID=UPI003BF49E9F
MLDDNSNTNSFISSQSSPYRHDEGDNRFVRNHRSNVQSDLIEITEDKLEVILIKHIEKLNIRDSWISPSSMLVAIITAKTTATFNDSFGLSAAVWETIFVLSGIFSAIWLIRNLCLIGINWKSSDLSSLICRIKNSQETTGTKETK